MTESLFIGVDGGATKCIVRVENEQGQLLGREVSGPANIRLSVAQSWQSIQHALSTILKSSNINPAHTQLFAGMGLAGCEVSSAVQSFLAHPHPFAALEVSSDAHAACLGAHAGADGSIIIIGTGVAGFQIQAGQTTKVSGWGFPQDDEGGGASIGLQAVKLTLQTLDGRAKPCDLSQKVYSRFENHLDRFITWTNQANSTAYAELAPIVIQQSAAGDEQALIIMREAALAIDKVGEALSPSLPCALIGGIAPFIEPYLDQKLRARLVPCQLTPDAGAIFLVKKFSGNPFK